ncbi:MAG: excinuclease ABC subunit UvrC [Actinomycetota bacterium]
MTTGLPWRPAAETIPDAPGCYLFRDRDGRVVYAGKAKSLRKRLANYFADPALLHPRTAAMIEQATGVEWIVAANEVESLHLEYNLIKTHRPRFNVRYRDDKSYPYLAITMNEEYPRAMVLRGAKRKGVRYFGPFAHAYAIRETLDLLLRTFPVRTCSQGVFDRCRRVGRPCLFYDIGKCAGPCVAHVSADEHRQIAADLIEFMEGNFEPVLERLDKQMHTASAALEFERAARLRDQLQSVRRAIEKQVVVSGRDEDLDAIAVAEDELEAAIQVFFVRGGRLVGRKGFVVDKVEELDLTALLGTFVRDLYMTEEDVPREVLVQSTPADAAVLGAWLSERRGTRVEFRVPQRGDRRALMQTVAQNATESFLQHKLRRRGDFAARAKQMRALQEALGLEEAPLRIEAFDISNTGPLEIVGSMVVFEDGIPKRSDYRTFKVRTVEGQDDFASMAEVIRRRFARYVAERDYPPAHEGRARRFAYPPNLVVVDGGKGQLNAALGALAELGIQEVTAVGLAKRFEEVWLPGADGPLQIPRGDEALYLLQHIRDEAHRFAIGYHRRLRGARMRRSDLDDVPGVGPERKRALLKKFGSVRRILQATEDEVAAVVGPVLAGRVIRSLRGLEPAPKPDRPAEQGTDAWRER